MIIKTALATAALAAFLPLAHSAISRAHQTEALASNIVAAAKASGANEPGAAARFNALQSQARRLAGAAIPQAKQPAAGGWQSAATWEPR